MISDIKRLVKLIQTLRGEQGCPWDQLQTPRTMVNYLIEEVHELANAIECDQTDEILEELGDVMFQIFFIALLYEEMGHFDIQKVVKQNVDKMTRRHPHVFAEKTAKSAEDVKTQWVEIKNKERNGNGKKSILDSIPRKLPALMRAYRISERAAGSGFDWDKISDVIDKVKEEWQEFLEVLNEKNQSENHFERLALEFGDILFTLVNVARFAQIHPETALTGSISKFENRFKKMEKRLEENGKTVSSASFEELNQLWESIKI